MMELAALEPQLEEAFVKVGEFFGVFLLGVLVGMLLRRLIDVAIILFLIVIVTAALGASGLTLLTHLASIFTHITDVVAEICGGVINQIKTAPHLVAFILGLVVGVMKK